MNEVRSRSLGSLPGSSAHGSMFKGDVEEMRVQVSQNFSPHGLKVINTHPNGGRYRLLHSGNFVWHTLAYGAEIRVEVLELPDFYNIHVPLIGGGRLTVGRQDVAAPLTIIGPRQRIDMNWSVDHDVMIIQIPEVLIYRVLEDQLGDAPKKDMYFEPQVTHESPLGRALTALSRPAKAGQPFPFAASSLAEHHFEQFLLHTLLWSQPHTYSADLGDPGAPATPAALRRARRFCEEHAAEPITLGDIATAARVSVRTLQHDFRTHLQTTPLAYLRQVRLAHAHADLVRIAQTGARTTVTEVAMRWGFTHLGRFACLYRETYGRSPSSTLYGSQ
ncbi:AraC-like protein [Nonomuraea polychroma]|uniref:AraC-like protein n=1 Tax=Nonomuraea polychroma TaxID=46176 RepID=A0A438MLB4_9ACTN|nr:AraC family transcriptional regulator [Nonomuraea polychroma]RVX46429.1 AraC-like protein [Nonomuraea polychroma]